MTASDRRIRPIPSAVQRNASWGSSAEEASRCETTRAEAHPHRRSHGPPDAHRGEGGSVLRVAVRRIAARRTAAGRLALNRPTPAEPVEAHRYSFDSATVAEFVAAAAPPTNPAGDPPRARSNGAEPVAEQRSRCPTSEERRCHPMRSPSRSTRPKYWRSNRNPPLDRPRPASRLPDITERREPGVHIATCDFPAFVAKGGTNADCRRRAERATVS